jgi:serine/threonine protein kinase/tetratricopeptide (TPR) repeat protein
MGVVYEAVHSKTGAAAAVKTLLDVGQASRLGIERELAALRDLEHPGVVRFLDQGESELGPWYAMELLQGETLGERVDADDTDQTVLDPTTPQWRAPHEPAVYPSSPGSSSSASAIGGRWSARLGRQLGWLAQVCHSLAYIHGQGVVHCDLKPANLVVTEGGRAVLVDFGVASRRRWRVGADAMRDASHRAGTLRYLAPERILAKPFDGRADLYALGCLLYTALTGRHIFSQSDPIQMLRAHISLDPLPIEELNPSVPRSLCEAVHALLRKDPASRPGSGLVALHALGDVGVDIAPWPRSPAPKHHLFHPPVVGRDRALDRLVGDVEKLQESGAVRILTGPAGVGKSRLAMGVVERLPTVSGACAVFTGAATQGVPLSLFEDLDVGSLAAPSATAQELRARLARLVEMRLVEVADGDPMVIVLDDVHDADELSLAALERVCAVARDRLWLVLALSRGEVETIEAPRLPVGPLPAASMAQFVAETLGQNDEAEVARVVTWITGCAEGNPLQAWAWLHTALDQGWLARDSRGYWQFRAPVAVLEQAPLPGAVEALIAQRVALLRPETRRFLRVMAVAGDPNDVHLLCAVAGDLPLSRVQLGLARLVAAGFLVESAGGTLRFSSPAVRAVAGQGADPDMHQRAATALRGRNVQPARLAVHYEAIGDVEGARDAHAEAARRAVADGAVVLAQKHLRDAIALHPEGSLGRAALQVTLADEVLLPMGSDVEARDLMDIAISVAAGTVVAASAHRVRARARHRSADPQGAVEDAERAVAIATESGGSRVAADAKRVLAEILTELGRIDEARGALTTALELVRSHGTDVEKVLALRELSSFHRLVGELHQGLACLTEAEAAALRAGDRWATLDVAAARGLFLVALGDLAAAEPLLTRVGGELRELGMTSRAVSVMNALGVVHSRNRNLPEAEAVLTDAMGLCDSAPRIAQLKHNLAMARLRIGRARGAAALLQEVLEHRAQTASVRGLAITHSALGQAHVALGEYEVALTHFRIATAHVVSMNAHRSATALDVAIGRAQALVCLGQIEAARAAVDAAPDSDDATYRARVALVGADIEVRAGDSAAALELLSVEAPTPDLRAWVEMCRGIIALGSRDSEGGEALLAAALAEFERLDHRPGVAACLHRTLLLARATGAPTTELETGLAAVTADLEVRLTDVGLPPYG